MSTNSQYILTHQDGCAHHPVCLTCPLPACIFDDPGVLTRIAQEARRGEVLRLKAAGMLPRHIAQRLGLSTRTVHRLLEPVTKTA